MANYTSTSLDNWEASSVTPGNSSFESGGGGDGGGLNSDRFHTSEAIRFYGSFVFVILGLLCNSFTVLVILVTRLRSTSFGLYLSALAIADCLFLVAELMKLSGDSRIDGNWTRHSNASCKFTYHLRYSAQLLSAMLITSITVERFFVIAFPLKMAVLVRSTMAKVIIVIIEYIIAAILGSYGSILFELVQFYPGMTPICLMNMAQAEIYSDCNLYITKIFGEVILPSVVLVFTLLIIRAVLVAAKARKEQLSNGMAGGSSSVIKQSSSEIQLTLMLLTVAVAFIVLRVPYTICWYMGHYSTLKAKSSDSQNAPLNDATNVTYVLVVANYAINFFLYCLSGGTFREHMMAVLHCRPNSAGRNASRRYSNSSKSPQTEMSSRHTLSRISSNLSSA